MSLDVDPVITAIDRIRSEILPPLMSNDVEMSVLDDPPRPSEEVVLPLEGTTRRCKEHLGDVLAQILGERHRTDPIRKMPLQIATDTRPRLNPVDPLGLAVHPDP